MFRPDGFGLHRRIHQHGWQGLQGFEGGARKREPMRIAGMGQQFAIPVDNGDRAKVHTFQRAATAEFYQWCEVHGRIISA